jgi:hypothetical protein
LTELDNQTEIIEFYRTRDALFTQLFFLKAILNYHMSYGRSRGAYLILRNNLHECLSEMNIIPPEYLKEYKFLHNDLNLSKKIQTLQWKDEKVNIEWEDVREIPMKFGWFENVWKEFLKNQKDDNQ